jgi:tetratricopeptide (TPR) repeat protein
VARDDLASLVQAMVWAQARYPPDSATRAMHRWLDLMERRTGHDSALRQTVLAANAQPALFAYLAERDTSLLARVLPSASEGGIVRAELALDRGDTATARRYAVAATGADLARGTLDSAKIPDGAGRLPWGLGWGDVFARLGHLEVAVAVYAWADSAPHPVPVAGSLVRSWAERGALLQQLGRTQEAIALYQRFIAAWDRADAGLQPLVERARQAVAALRGEVQERRS